ncbi:MAG: hypothetical protein HN509_12970 [Halobacteriovoraceae bacterium]|nr:hypothetical protein [Halobacteriovoraceae bacterium]
MPRLFLSILVLFTSFSLLAKEGKVRGVLFRDTDGQVKLKSLVEGREIIRQLTVPKMFKYTLDKKMLNSPNYTLEVVGEVTDSKIVAKQTPTVVGDILDRKGILEKVAGKFYLNGELARFGRTKPIYGIPFDDQSKKHYIGKEVITQGHFETNGDSRIFVINAILEKGLLTAADSGDFLPPLQFNEDPFDFVLNKMRLNKNSQTRTPWRGTLVQDQSKPVKAGDPVLIITLSGRQGDAPGASAGHFAIGMGSVQKDLSIKGETFNFYFEGPKEVLAGNTDLTSYFGHLIQGQQNYRPTYTVYVYGLKEKDLKAVRDLYEVELHKVRTEKGLVITPGYNCTTTSNYALRTIGIYGQHYNLGRRLTRPRNLWYLTPNTWWANNSRGENTWETAQIAGYALSRPAGRFIPRSALESFIKNFQTARWRKRKNISRVDYVFIPQTPSLRQIGGMSYDNPFEGKKIISFDKERESRKDEIKKAQDILFNKSGHSEEQIKWAEKYWAKDQRAVKEILDTID